MNMSERNMIRFHLEVLYGISVKKLDKKSDRMLMSGTKIFGAPLERVPRRYIPEFGLVPCFLVDACSFLLERAATVGLFRKSGSLPRIKALRDKLNGGVSCLSTALPCDVATVIKQFCRELPEPLFPCELQAALLEAQALSNLQDRTSALQLLSCLLPARNASCLHYLFDFLNKVSQRCAENLMTSSNLATIFTPCLLPPSNKTEMSETRLELRVLILCAFIENPRLFGVIPKTVKDNLEYLKLNYPEETPFMRGHRKRHTFKVIRSAKTASRRSKVESAEPKQGQGSASADRPVLRRTLGLETFPNIKMFRMCTHDAGVSSGTALLDDSTPQKKSGKTPRERLKRDLEHFYRLAKGQTTDKTQDVAAGKVSLWRRRITL